MTSPVNVSFVAMKSFPELKAPSVHSMTSPVNVSFVAMRSFPELKAPSVHCPVTTTPQAFQSLKSLMSGLTPSAPSVRVKFPQHPAAALNRARSDWQVSEQVLEAGRQEASAELANEMVFSNSPHVFPSALMLQA